MPTPPPKTGSANWTAPHHRLSDDTRQELISFLGLDPTVRPDELGVANHALAEVEKWLGFYPGADTAHKNAPKASDFVRSLSSAEKLALKLQRNLNDSHQWIRSEITECGANLEALNLELEKLLDAAKTIQAKYESVESRGPPKFEALRHLVFKLREIFDQFYQDSVRPGRKIGFLQPLSEFESAEQDFIMISLDDAEIPFTKKQLRRLLDEPNVTLKSNRRDKIYDQKNLKRARNKEHNRLKKENK